MKRDAERHSQNIYSLKKSYQMWITKKPWEIEGRYPKKKTTKNEKQKINS